VSLINEALQRAREEVVRQQAAKKGVPLAPAPRFKEKSSWLTAAVLILAVALAISIVALLGLSKQLPVPTNNSNLETSEVTSPTNRSAMSTGVAETPTTSPIETPPKDKTTPPSDLGSISANPATAEQPALEESSPSGLPRAIIGPRAERIEEPEAESISRKPAAIETSPPAVTESSVESESYVRHADLKDNISIELGGIAWSESGPYALLNGRVVGIGESVSGLIVRQIEPLEVVLEGQGRTISLRLK
jgi:hypothetical protein